MRRQMAVVTVIRPPVRVVVSEKWDLGQKNQSGVLGKLVNSIRCAVMQFDWMKKQCRNGLYFDEMYIFRCRLD